MAQKTITILFSIVTAFFLWMIALLPIAMYNNGEDLNVIKDVVIIIALMYSIMFLLPYLAIRKQLKTVIEKDQSLSKNIAVHSINIRNIAFQLIIMFFMVMAGGVSHDARSAVESLSMFLVIISIPILIVNLNLMYKAYQVKNYSFVLFSIMYLLIQIGIMVFPFFWMGIS